MASLGMPDTGFNCPDVVNIVFCRSTRSEMQTLEGEDAWIRREWLDVEPGAEAVDLRDVSSVDILPVCLSDAP